MKLSMLFSVAAMFTIACSSGPICSPSGAYQYTFTTESGNCGDISNQPPVVLDKYATAAQALSNAAAVAELSWGQDPVCTQDGDTTSGCTASVSATCSGFYTPPPIEGGIIQPLGSDSLSTYSVVSLTDTNSKLTGKVSVKLTNSGVDECSGTYSFTATLQ